MEGWHWKVDPNILSLQPPGQLAWRNGFLVWDSGAGASGICAQEINRTIEEIRKERDERILQGARLEG